MVILTETITLYRLSDMLMSRCLTGEVTVRNGTYNNTKKVV